MLLSKHSSLYIQYCFESKRKSKSITALHVFVYLTADGSEFVLVLLKIMCSFVFLQQSMTYLLGSLMQLGDRVCMVYECLGGQKIG